jgi:hypothetical protein
MKIIKIDCIYKPIFLKYKNNKDKSNHKNNKNKLDFKKILEKNFLTK